MPTDDPATLPKVQPDADSIRQMLRRGSATPSHVISEIEVTIESDGVRVAMTGEVPTEAVRTAVMREVEARVVNLKKEEFNLDLAGSYSDALELRCTAQ